jgi:hypothetical protein
MTAKVFIQNQLVKTLYLQRGKLSEAIITQRVDELYRDIERIGLDFLIEIVDKPKKLCKTGKTDTTQRT